MLNSNATMLNSKNNIKENLLNTAKTMFDILFEMCTSISNRKFLYIKYIYNFLKNKIIIIFFLK